MENNKNEDKEKIATPEQSQEKVGATPEELEKQIALLQAQLEASRSQTTVFTQNETAKLDKSALELGINNPEEVSAIKSEVAGIENQKQGVITSGTKEIEKVKNENSEEKKETAVVDEEPVASLETVEDDPKQKAFNEIQARLNSDIEKKTNDPENPLNKVINASKDNNFKLYFNGGFNNSGDLRRLGIEQTQIDDSAQSLLDKGIINEKELTNYLLSRTLLEGRNTNVNMPVFTKLIGGIPAQIVDKMAYENSMFGEALDKYYETTQAEIKKEKESPRSDSGKLVNLLSNIGRFAPKEEMAEVLPGAVEQYLKGGYNISRLRQDNGSYPVIENLYEAGFSDQAEKILEKGFSSGSINVETILEYQKKGYITEQKAKDMYEKKGLLE